MINEANERAHAKELDEKLEKLLRAYPGENEVKKGLIKAEAKAAQEYRSAIEYSLNRLENKHIAENQLQKAEDRLKTAQEAYIRAARENDKVDSTAASDGKLPMSDNKEHGFWGTFKRGRAGSVTKAWDAAMKEYISREGATPDEAREFLDSTSGRHLADAVLDGVNSPRSLDNRKDAELAKRVAERIRRSRASASSASMADHMLAKRQSSKGSGRRSHASAGLRKSGMGSLPGVVVRRG